MSDQLKKSREMTCEGSLNATSSAGFSVGPSPCNSPDGETPQCGLPVSRASRSALQERAEGQMMLDISGPTCGGSSKSAALQRCLASRLLQRLDVNGSPKYSLTWREWGMPSREPICALRASGRRICGRDCGGWASGWPTPMVVERVRSEETLKKCAEFRKRNANQNTVPLYLPEVARTAGWPTPMVMDYWMTNNPRTDGGQEQLTNVVQKAGWQTPRAIYGEHPGMEDEGHLTGQAKTAGWRTPDAGSHRNVGTPTKCLLEGTARKDQQIRLVDQVHMLVQTTGATPGSDAVMEPRGVLNPAFPLWLMGFPEAWATCAPGVENWAMIQRALCEMPDASEREPCEGQGTR